MYQFTNVTMCKCTNLPIYQLDFKLKDLSNSADPNLKMIQLSGIKRDHLIQPWSGSGFVGD